MPLQAVLSLRFKAGLRLLRALGCWEGVLSRRMLTDLALGRVLVGHMMPYLRGAVNTLAATPHLAIARLDAVAAALPATWFTGKTSL